MKGKRLYRLLVLPVVVMLWMIGWLMYSTGNNETEKESLKTEQKPQFAPPARTLKNPNEACS